MAKWTAFPYDSADYTYDTAALKKNWARLHAGDAEPLPKDCLLYTSPSPRDISGSRMPSSA